MAEPGLSQWLRLLPCLLRGVSAPGLSESLGQFPGVPSTTESCCLLHAGAGEAVGGQGGSCLCGGQGDLDSFLAALNPAERRGGFMKAEGSHADMEMPGIKPAFMHAYLEVSAVHNGMQRGVWVPNTDVPAGRVCPRTDSMYPRAQPHTNSCGHGLHACG